MTIASFWQWLIHLDLTPVLWIAGILAVLLTLAFILGSIGLAADRARQRINQKKWATRSAKEWENWSPPSVSELLADAERSDHD